MSLMDQCSGVLLSYRLVQSDSRYRVQSDSRHDFQVGIRYRVLVRHMDTLSSETVDQRLYGLHQI